MDNAKKDPSNWANNYDMELCKFIYFLNNANVKSNYHQRWQTSNFTNVNGDKRQIWQTSTTTNVKSNSLYCLSLVDCIVCEIVLFLIHEPSIYVDIEDLPLAYSSIIMSHNFWFTLAILEQSNSPPPDLPSQMLKFILFFI